MKQRLNFSILLLFLSVGLFAQDQGFNPENCTFNGKPLYGKILFVTSSPDVKVRIVNCSEDLKVRLASSSADECGEWEIVKCFEDIRVQIVTCSEDIKVRYVTAFEGISN